MNGIEALHFVIRKTPLAFFWLFCIRLIVYVRADESISLVSIPVGEVVDMFLFSIILVAGLCFIKIILSIHIESLKHRQESNLVRVVKRSDEVR
jgi:hypothetical protein